MILENTSIKKKGNMAYIQNALNAHIPKIAATQFMTLDAACILSFLAKELHLKLKQSNWRRNWK